jgi:CheY-like chemotaxis protein
MIAESEHSPVVLLIDDEDDYHFFREAMKEVFPCADLKWLRYSCGLLPSINRIKPSLIFVDFNMPVVNGLECVRQLRSHPDFTNVPIVMWSTSRNSQKVEEAYDAGIQWYLEKPLEHQCSGCRIEEDP